MEVFESVSSRPGFHSDLVGPVPVGGEFPFFSVLLISSENEIAHFEFSFSDFLTVASGYFFVLALRPAR
jgi:hypothetical protein